MIPDTLTGRDQWIAWTTEQRGDKLTKTPRAPWATDHAGLVNATDPDNWTDFETASEWGEMMPNWGVAYVFAASGPIVGIDLDDCIVNKTIQPWAWQIMDDVDSFTEYSPSGTGLHSYATGELDAAMKNDEEGVEMYDRDRFFTVTGSHVEETPTVVTEAQAAIDRLVDEYMVEDPTPAADDDTEPAAPTPTGQAHPLYDLAVREVYPGKPTETNIEHPVHGSSTGANFKIFADRETAICWHGGHSYGRGDGCGLNACHLLYMEATDETDCRAVRSEWPTPAMVFAAWVEAYNRRLVTGADVPYQAIEHIIDQFDLADIESGGATAWATYRTACRIIRAEWDVPVELDD
jgi:hypothetical protein